MFKHITHVPKHRAVPDRSLSRAPRKALKNTLVLSAIAVAGTGTAVGGGVALHSASDAGTLTADATGPTQVAQTVQPSSSAVAEALRDRTQSLSRSYSRGTTTPAKKPVRHKDARPRRHRATVHHQPAAPAHRTPASAHAPAAVSSEDPKQIASGMLSSYGWDSGQFGCLVSLWNRESGWRVDADNPSSGAYGIPQSLPGSKMASAGADWRTNPVTQIRWGLGYIRASYGSPCGAWAHSEATGWY